MPRGLPGSGWAVLELTGTLSKSNQLYYSFYGKFGFFDGNISYESKQSLSLVRYVEVKTRRGWDSSNVAMTPQKKDLILLYSATNNSTKSQKPPVRILTTLIMARERQPITQSTWVVTSPLPRKRLYFKLPNAGGQTSQHIFCAKWRY